MPGILVSDSFFVLKCALFPGGITTFFFQERRSLVKTCSAGFRSSILAIFFPGNKLRKFPVGNIIDTNSMSTKNIYGETASEFSFQNSHKVFPL